MSGIHIQRAMAAAPAILLVLLAALPALAEPQLSLSSAGAVLGGSATLKLHLDNAGDLCTGVNGKILLPPGVTLADIAPADRVSENFTLVAHALEDPGNIYTFVAYSTTDTFTADSGPVLLLTVQVSEVAAEVGLDVEPLLEAEVPLLASGLAAGDGSTSLAHARVGGNLLLMREPIPILNVGPAARELGAAGGDAEFLVTNLGFNDMAWTAAPAGPADWITIVSGAEGVNEGTVLVRCEANPHAGTRTAELVVDAGDVPGSPALVTVVQSGDATPRLSVTPPAMEVPATSGMFNLSVANDGNGTMPWTAQVVTGFEWLTIMSGQSGTDGGSIALSHYPNMTSAARSALIEIVAPDALDSPQVITITQQTSAGPLLVVSPPERTVSASAGTAEFTVGNAGGGVMAWTAGVAEGAGWLTVESGTSGVQDGTIRVAFTRNMMIENRVGTIRIEAEGAGESPADVRLVQRGRQLLVITAPNGGEHFARGETISLAWTSESETTEAVSLMLLKGGGLHTTIAVTADNSGAHQWTVPSNLAPGDDYQIQIIDVANAAIHDESDDAFAVACPPDAPQQVTASDDRADLVLVTWDAVDSAEFYQVYRIAADSTAAPTLLGTTQETHYEDSSALAPEKAWVGCRRQTKVYHYLYSVCAVNVCAQSAPSEADDGCRIEEADKWIYEAVLPAGPIEDGIRLIQPDAALAVRVRSASSIDANSIAASVVWSSGSSDEVQWLPLNEQDGWAVYTPEQPWQAGESITMTVSAATIAGEEIGPFVYQFQAVEAAEPAEALRQPHYDDFDGSGIDRTKEDADRVELRALETGFGIQTDVPAFVIAPLEPFETPQRVWLPMPESATADTVRVEYYHIDGRASGWYAADDVEGWLIPGSELGLDLDGTRYLGITVRHGGVVRLAPGERVEPVYEAAAFPYASNAVDMAVFVMVLLVLGLGRTATCRRA